MTQNILLLQKFVLVLIYGDSGGDGGSNGELETNYWMSLVAMLWLTLSMNKKRYQLQYL